LDLIITTRHSNIHVHFVDSPKYIETGPIEHRVVKANDVLAAWRVRVMLDCDWQFIGRRAHERGVAVGDSDL